MVTAKKEEKAGREGPCSFLSLSLSFVLSAPGTRPKALAANRLKLLNGGSTGASTVNRRTLFRSRAQAGDREARAAAPFRIQRRGRPLSANCKIIGRRGEGIRDLSHVHASRSYRRIRIRMRRRRSNPGNETRAPGRSANLRNWRAFNASLRAETFRSVLNSGA